MGVGINKVNCNHIMALLFETVDYCLHQLILKGNKTNFKDLANSKLILC